MELAAALASARTALELIKLGVAARDEAKVQAALIEANMRLLDLSTAALSLAEKNGALVAQLAAAQSENRQIKAKLDDRAAYALHEVRPGAFVYAAKAAGDGSKPAHYLCQPCYDKGIKTVLRRIEGSTIGNLLECAADRRHDVTQLP